MSEKYDEYIETHRQNVFKAFCWLEENLPEVFDDEEFKARCRHACEFGHDKSKYDIDEYSAYDAYFYGGNRSYEVVEQFNRAWLNHIHKNKHHWQHWILINDNPDEGEIILDMPRLCIIEMICDWMSFSIAKGDMYEIFNWYDEHKDYMKLSERTRISVNGILEAIREKLLKSDVNGKQ